LAPYSQDLRITVDSDERVRTVRLSGEIDVASAGAFNASLFDGVSFETDVIVDLSGISFIDAAGVIGLVGARRRVTAQGHTLIVRDPSPSVVRVLAVTGLDRILAIEP